MSVKENLRKHIESNALHYTQSQNTEIIKKISMMIDSFQGIVGAYCSIKNEPSINSVLGNFQNRQFALPKLSDDSSAMYFGEYRLFENLQVAKFGFLEPIKPISIVPDIAFIPGLAFDSRGFRLGYGYGFYDRYLEKHGSKVIKVGVCFQDRLLNLLPAEKHDIKMDYVLTENSLLKIC
jgi:5-formyltetrahydrofolate cyclo-ligase